MPASITEITTTCAPVRYVVVGMLDNNVYFVEDGKGGVIVCDPSDDVDTLLEVLEGRPVSAIFVTHRHFDHCGALAALKEATGAPVYCGAIDAKGVEGPEAGSHGVEVDPCKVDVYLENNDEIKVGALTWRAIHTPGHTEGGMSYYLDPACVAGDAAFSFTFDAQSKLPLVMSGDTLFDMSTGRTDFEGGSDKDMVVALKRLGTLPDETIVLPGHSALTTIGKNRFWVIDAYARYAGLEE